MFMFFRLDYMIGQFEVVDVFILNFSLNHQMFNIPVFDSNHIHKMFNRQFFDSKCKFAKKKLFFLNIRIPLPSLDPPVIKNPKNLINLMKNTKGLINFIIR